MNANSKYDSFVKVSLFILIFTSSLVSLQINGISVNRIGLLPFWCAVFLKEYSNFNISKVEIAKNLKYYFYFLILSLFSSIFAIVSPISSANGFISAQINYLLFVLVIYLPIILLLSNSKDRRYYSDLFKKYFLIIVKLHAYIIIAQFFIYAITGINISSLLFDTILHVDTGVMWTTHIYGTSIVQRASGLNYDPAFSSYLMIVGFILTKNKKDKFLFLLSVIFSQSRTGILALIVGIVLEYVFNFKMKVSKKQFVKGCCMFLGMIVACIVLVNISFVQTQLDSLLERLIDISGKSTISSQRHTQYPLLSLDCWAHFNNAIHWLLGAGPRASGTVASNISGVKSTIPLSAQRVWAIECDFAELLLGYGIIGLFLYYANLIRMMLSKKEQIKIFAILMILIGFFYDYSSLSINMITLIFLGLELFESTGDNYGKSCNCVS